MKATVTRHGDTVIAVSDNPDDVAILQEYGKHVFDIAEEQRRKQRIEDQHDYENLCAKILASMENKKGPLFLSSSCGVPETTQIRNMLLDQFQVIVRDSFNEYKRKRQIDSVLRPEDV